jgi:hypothetical protein
MIHRQMATTPLWVALAVAAIGVVGTVVGTIGGVLMTQRRSDRREDRNWNREREREQERWAREDAARTFEHRRDAYSAFYEAVREMARQAYDHGMGLGDHNELPFDWQLPIYRRLQHLRLYATPAVADAATAAYNAAWRWGDHSTHGIYDEDFYNRQEEFDAPRRSCSSLFATPFRFRTADHLAAAAERALADPRLGYGSSTLPLEWHRHILNVHMNGTAILVATIEAVATIAVALVSVFWGKQALALKDETIEARQDQIQQLQELKDETIRAKDAEIEQLRGLTTPKLIEHFKGQETIFEGLLDQAKKALTEKDEALKAGELNAGQHGALERQLAKSEGIVADLQARLEATQDVVRSMSILSNVYGSTVESTYGPTLVGNAMGLRQYSYQLPLPTLAQMIADGELVPSWRVGEPVDEARVKSAEADADAEEEVDRSGQADR